MRVFQHVIGMANAWFFVNRVAEGSYLLAAVSLVCVFFSASWNLDYFKDKK